VDSELAIRGIFSIDDLCDDCEDGSGSGENRETCHLEVVTSFTKAHAAYETVKSFIYVHSFGGCNEQNILNLELVLFCL
jgi:hypothetical protein